VNLCGLPLGATLKNYDPNLENLLAVAAYCSGAFPGIRGWVAHVCIQAPGYEHVGYKCCDKESDSSKIGGRAPQATIRAEGALQRDGRFWRLN
jgi:hypothetical protein